MSDNNDLNIPIEETDENIVEDVVEETETEESEESEETEDEEDTEEEDEEDDADPVTRKQALQLFRALQDPNKAADIIRTMASAAGVIAPEQKEEAEETILQILQKNLGNYAFLAESLGPAIEKIVTKLIGKEVKPLQQTIAEREAAQQNARVNAALAEIWADKANFPHIKQVESTMLRLVGEMPVKPGTDPKVYFSRLYRIAVAEMKTPGKASSNTPLKGQSPRPGRSGNSISSPAPTKVTARDAVAAAMQKLGL